MGNVDTDANVKIVQSSQIDWQEHQHGDMFYRSKELSGDHLGARIEELPPGQNSSHHHYHSSEEEHVFVLSGEIELVLDSGTHTLHTGDHVCFMPGSSPHHMENRSSKPCSYLVYGERHPQDVVVYPQHQTMLLKGVQGLESKMISYRSIDPG